MQSFKIVNFDLDIRERGCRSSVTHQQPEEDEARVVYLTQRAALRSSNLGRSVLVCINHCFASQK